MKKGLKVLAAVFLAINIALGFILVSQAQAGGFLRCAEGEDCSCGSPGVCQPPVTNPYDLCDENSDCN